MFILVNRKTQEIFASENKLNISKAAKVSMYKLRKIFALGNFIEDGNLIFIITEKIKDKRGGKKEKRIK